jgi:hypothetical protein
MKVSRRLETAMMDMCLDIYGSVENKSANLGDIMDALLDFRKYMISALNQNKSLVISIKDGVKPESEEQLKI